MEGFKLWDVRLAIRVWAKVKPVQRTLGIEVLLTYWWSVKKGNILIGSICGPHIYIYIYIYTPFPCSLEPVRLPSSNSRGVGFIMGSVSHSVFRLYSEGAQYNAAGSRGLIPTLSALHTFRPKVPGSKLMHLGLGPRTSRSLASMTEP